MNELVEDLDVELETVIQEELKLKASKSIESKMEERCSKELTTSKQPSLPEPTEPPPPPPPPPAIISRNNTLTTTKMVTEMVTATATATAKATAPASTVAVKRRSRLDENGEPIYESVKPREEQNGPLINGTNHNQTLNANLKDTQLITRNNHHIIQPPQQYAQQQETVQPEREQRRKYRVEKKLMELEEKKQVAEGETTSATYHDIVEFAQNYFNSHERSPEGTIMATLTRKSRGKSIEFVPKYEMVTYYKGSTIPNSHIHMYDPDNVNVACSVFRVSAPTKCIILSFVIISNNVTFVFRTCANICVAK